MSLFSLSLYGVGREFSPFHNVYRNASHCRFKNKMNGGAREILGLPFLRFKEDDFIGGLDRISVFKKNWTGLIEGRVCVRGRQDVGCEGLFSHLCCACLLGKRVGVREESAGGEKGEWSRKISNLLFRESPEPRAPSPSVSLWSRADNFPQRAKVWEPRYQKAHRELARRNTSMDIKRGFITSPASEAQGLFFSSSTFVSLLLPLFVLPLLLFSFISFTFSTSLSGVSSSLLLRLSPSAPFPPPLLCRVLKPLPHLSPSSPFPPSLLCLLSPSSPFPPSLLCRVLKRLNFSLSFLLLLPPSFIHFSATPFHDFDLLFYPFILFRLLPLRFPSFSSLPNHSSSLLLFFIQHSLALFPSLIIFFLFLLFSLSSSSNPNLPFSLLFSSSFYSSSSSLSSPSLFPHLLSSVDRPLR
ncbi:hypothetical protein C7M84_007653 [Penaeus vannamei]|uniref:Uncharacterized protein n=1 Tax=Penaeus vannamei TaxID=6689 RepID=A0A423TBL5_PENVA|nr:hypothetical protein C7M84_007653 [Penaeus vannamei]